MTPSSHTTVRRTPAEIRPNVRIFNTAELARRGPEVAVGTGISRAEKGREAVIADPSRHPAVPEPDEATVPRPGVRQPDLISDLRVFPGLRGVFHPPEVRQVFIDRPVRGKAAARHARDHRAVRGAQGAHHFRSVLRHECGLPS